MGTKQRATKEQREDGEDRETKEEEEEEEGGQCFTSEIGYLLLPLCSPLLLCPGDEGWLQRMNGEG